MNKWSRALLLASFPLLEACGGGGEAANPSASASVSANSASANPASANPANAPSTSPSQSGSGTASAKTLPAPTLRFNDTGISLSDGLTRDGRWSVSGLNGLGWEYSLDLGQNWIRGAGDFFVVEGDGSKMIWVRTRDEQGNNSEIVKVSCTLDTMAPAPVQTQSTQEAGLRRIEFKGLETQARWEYRFDDREPWVSGVGKQLWLLGNGPARLFTRQVDAAGNSSDRSELDLVQASAGEAIEFSTNPLAPTLIAQLPESSEVLILHGSVRQGDADYVRIDVPPMRSLASLKLVHYRSEDKIAFFALQRSVVFDAGVDTSRMIAFGHFGPEKLGQNLVENLTAAQLSAGPIVLWMQQTGSQSTDYAFELRLSSSP
jgi:hypothetical protein